MAERNEKVFERVRQELTKSPKLGSRELYGMAQEWDKSIAQDSLQQFHARYVLPIKREQSKARGDSKPRTRGPARRTRRTAVTEAAPTTAVAEEPAAPARRGLRALRGGAQNAESIRDRARAAILEFARDFANAETRSEIVKVMSRVDDYVDRIAANEG